MTTAEAIEILKYFNKWRRGADIPQPNPTEIGKAIDKIINDYEKR